MVFEYDRLDAGDDVRIVSSIPSSLQGAMLLVPPTSYTTSVVSGGIW